MARKSKERPLLCESHVHAIGCRCHWLCCLARMVTASTGAFCHQPSLLFDTVEIFFKNYSLCNCISAYSAVRLVFRGCKACLWVVNIGHLCIVVLVCLFGRSGRIVDLNIINTVVISDRCFFFSAHQALLGSRHEFPSKLFLFRSLDKASLDTQTTIG